MNQLKQDLAYAVRVLFKSWSVSLIAVATLALGIGANTAIFSVVNSVLLRPLPFAHSDRLVYLLEQIPGFPMAIPMNAPDYLAFCERQKSFSQLAIFANKHFDLSGTGTPERIEAARASASLFSVLGVSPLMGRTFTREEDESSHEVVVLSYGLWRRAFGADPEILGRTVQLDRQPFTVIGVMPQSFQFPLRGPAWNNQPAELWVPMAFTKEEKHGWGNMYNDNVLGLLKPGVTVAQAQADMSRALAQIEALYPASLVAYFKGSHIGANVTLYSKNVTGDVRVPLLLLLVAVGFVLLIACANVANLLLSRATARQKEMALRAALGADRVRLARQMITESLVLGLFSGLIAVVIGGWGMELILSFAPSGLPRIQEVTIDWRVFLFALVLSLATAILIGITPAIEATRIDPLDSLKEGGRGGGPSRARRKLQSALIVSQTALAVMLLIGAGLLTRSFAMLLSTDPGFRPERVVTATVALPLRAYPHISEIQNFWKSLLTNAESLPGVSHAGFSTDLPLDVEERDGVTLEGYEGSRNNLPNIAQSWIMGDYFGAMGITLKRGRYFTPAEIIGPRSVVIISEDAARTYWPGQDAIGKRIRYDGDNWRTVIGIVGDVKDASMQSAAGPHAYTPYLEEHADKLEDPNFDELRTFHVALRTNVDPALEFNAIRSAVAAVDPQIAVDDLTTMDATIDKSLAPQRFDLSLVALFAVLAVFLAAVGVYGVLSYSVSQRTREFGVRIALGAQRGHVLRMAVGEGMKLAVLGIAAGLTAGFLLTGLINSLLFGITARDPLTFIGVALVIILVSLGACMIPARRAMRVDPIIALRYE
ncbi:MAG TPA: ABC transporter permease [Candidatus Acidoferrum sp.]|nr:ABC transporter permease [Candidatus Acidoferrum sp.]